MGEIRAAKVNRAYDRQNCYGWQAAGGYCRPARQASILDGVLCPYGYLPDAAGSMTSLTRCQNRQ